MGIADETALYALGYWMHENHPARIEGLCLNDVQKKTPCDECSAACPEGLFLHGAAPDWRGCADCGLCVTSCPAQAIDMSSACCERIEGAASCARGCVVFSCERFDGPSDAAMTCLAALSWDELAAIALKVPVVLKTSPCKECPDGQNVARVKETVRRLKGFFGDEEFSRRFFPSIPASLRIEREKGLTAGSERRRALASVAETVKNGVLHPVRPGDVVLLCRSRAMLIDALEALPEQERPTLRWRTLVEDGACKGCGICVNMCPHEALSLAVDGPKGRTIEGGLDGRQAFDADISRENADAAGAACSQDIPRYLVHDASRCTQCGLCYMSCPQENLGGWDELATKKLPALRYNSIDVAMCEKCGRLFKAEPGKTRCPACSRFRFAPR